MELFSYPNFNVIRISELSDDLGTVEGRDFCRCNVVIFLASMAGSVVPGSLTF